MNQDENQDRIDAYLLGVAKPEERRELEDEASRNQELSEALGATELAMAAIELAEDRALKARLQKLEQKLAGTPPVTETAVRSLTERQEKNQARVVDMKHRRAGKLRLFGYAAALLLALAVGWWALNPGGGFDAPQLAMDSFRPYENITTGTVRGDNEQTAEAAAFAEYDAGNFAEAEEKLAALPESSVNKFYLGQSLLAQNKFAEARSVFFELWQQPDFALQQESYYYLGLADLGKGDVTEARNTLSKIARDTAHPMQKEAEALLAKM